MQKAAFLIFGLFFAGMTLSYPALAKEPIFGVRRNLLDAFHTSWEAEGPTTKLEDLRFIIREYETARPCWRGACKTAQGAFHTSIPASGVEDKYVLLVAYTFAEDIRVDDETGLPVVSGAFLDSFGNVVGGMQSATLIHPASVEGKWSVVSSVFPVAPMTNRLRVDFSQANRRGTPTDGRAAGFLHPGLFILSKKVEAESVLALYSKLLAEDASLPADPAL